MVNGFWVYGCLMNAGGLWVEQKIIFFLSCDLSKVYLWVYYVWVVVGEKKEREVINKKKSDENR